MNAIELFITQVEHPDNLGGKGEAWNREKRSKAAEVVQVHYRDFD